MGGVISSSGFGSAAVAIGLHQPFVRRALLGILLNKRNISFNTINYYLFIPKLLLTIRLAYLGNSIIR